MVGIGTFESPHLVIFNSHGEVVGSAENRAFAVEAFLKSGDSCIAFQQ